MKRALSVLLTICLAITWLAVESAPAGAAVTATMSGRLHLANRGKALILGPRSLHLEAGTYLWAWRLKEGPGTGKYAERRLALAADTYTWVCFLQGPRSSGEKFDVCLLSGRNTSHFATLSYNRNLHVLNLAPGIYSQLDPQF